MEFLRTLLSSHLDVQLKTATYSLSSGKLSYDVAFLRGSGNCIHRSVHADIYRFLYGQVICCVHPARRQEIMKKNKPRQRKSRNKKTENIKATAAGAAHDGETMVNESAQVIEGRAEETGKKKKGVGFFEFFQQVRNEGEKVSWTGMNETMISTVMVLVMVVIMVIFFFLVDQLLRLGICGILPIECVPIS